MGKTKLCKSNPVHVIFNSPMFEGTERGLSNIIVVSILFDTCGSFLCICRCYKLSSVYSLQYFSLNCLLRSAWTSELGQQMCDCENSGQRILVLSLAGGRRADNLPEFGIFHVPPAGLVLQDGWQRSCGGFVGVAMTHLRVCL